MASVFIMASALEVGLVVFAAVIFLAMLTVGLAVLIWTVAGFASATHTTPTPHH
jgi:hypothetical protein